jgi:hypothetical protein
MYVLGFQECFYTGEENISGANPNKTFEFTATTPAL